MRPYFAVLKGLLSGRCAYAPPDIVQIDLTDNCRSHCLLCWNHSPLLQARQTRGMHSLEYGRLKKFLSELADAGVREICFSGGGEPFEYPHIWDILEFTQKLGVFFHINTNFTLIGPEDVKRLVSFQKLLSIKVSVWASEPSLYAKLHGRAYEDLGIIEKNLKRLNLLKSRKLEVRIYAVINKLNYFQVPGLLDWAKRTGSDSMEFAVCDVVPGATDIFLLDTQELADVKKGLKAAQKHKGVRIANQDVFLRRLSSPDADKGIYDRSVEKLPCYAGWTFLRLNANGDINSCLKSHRRPIGNIYKDSFLSVWNGPLAQEFRFKSLERHKDRTYFQNIGNGAQGEYGCARLCDNKVEKELLHRLAGYVFGK